MKYPEQYDAMNHTTLTPKVGVGVVIIQNGKILLMKRSGSVCHGRGTWSVFGGHIELGETVAEAAKREAREEIGIEIELITNLDWSECLLPEYHSISVFVQADIVSGNPKILEPDKADGLCFFSYDVIASLPLFDPFKRYYESGRLQLVQQ